MTATAVQQTSTAALASLTDISQRQQDVYSVISTFGPLCNKEIARRLNVPVNEVTGRVFELRGKDLVKESHRALYQATGKRVIWWTTT